MFPDNIEKVLIELIPTKYSKVDKLHYCWSYFQQCHRLELKIRPTDEFNFIGGGLIKFMKKSILSNQIQSLIIDMMEYK